MSDINLAKDDLVYFGYRVEPYFASHIILTGMLDTSKLKNIFDWNTGVRWIQYNYEFFQVKSDLERLEDELRVHFQKGGIRYVESLVAQCIKSGEDLLAVSRTLGKEASSAVDNQHLISLLEKYFQTITNYTPFYSLAMFEKPVIEIADRISRKYSQGAEEQARVFDLVTSSAHETAVEREQEALLMLGIKPEKERKELAQGHAIGFGWLSVRFFLGEPWSVEDVLARLKNLNSYQAEQNLNSRVSARQNRENEIHNLVSGFEKEDKDFVRLVREIVFLRNQRADYYNESAYHVRPLLLKVADELGISYSDMLNLSTPEIVRSLKGLFNYKSAITERKKNFIVFHQGTGTVILEGGEVEDFVKRFPLLNRTSGQELKIEGKIGYKGLVKGIVKVVFTAEDIKKVNKGDVLVTAMTIPNFIPAMEKAVAFVTDEGGVTCHAAIVAREMRKPCIIGTKHATKALSDGDLVEVNADKGIVTILNHEQV